MARSYESFAIPCIGPPTERESGPSTRIGCRFQEKIHALPRRDLAEYHDQDASRRHFELQSAAGLEGSAVCMVEGSGR